MKTTSLVAMILLAGSHLPARAEEPLTLARAVEILQQQVRSTNSSRARLEIQIIQGVERPEQSGGLIFPSPR